MNNWSSIVWAFSSGKTKELCCFPVKRKLQMFFVLKDIAQRGGMQRDEYKTKDLGILSTQKNGKHIDHTYVGFEKDERKTRFGLASDDFNRDSCQHVTTIKSWKNKFDDTVRVRGVTDYKDLE